MVKLRRGSVIAGLSEQISQFFYPAVDRVPSLLCVNQRIRGPESPAAG
jgi:hypothetical protein